MKVTLNWLKQYVDFNWSPEELAERLTMLGVEVEGVKKISGEFEGVVVAQVITRDKHPNADKLSLCRVNDGKGERQIVCGAQNFKAGDKVPLILPGATLPPKPGEAPFTIKVGKIRGIESHGMMCSPQELGLPEAVDGLLILREDAQVGQPFAEYLGRAGSDVVYDLEVTPNRPDLNSLIGIAREISALTGNALRLPQISLAAKVSGNPPHPSPLPQGGEGAKTQTGIPLTPALSPTGGEGAKTQTGIPLTPALSPTGGEGAKTQTGIPLTPALSPTGGEGAKTQTGNPLTPTLSPTGGEGEVGEMLAVQLDDAELCPRYVARIVRGVKVGPSPDWLRSAIEKIGLRSISNVVDVTNYVMYEIGQPLHAFDYHLIAKDASGKPTIVVRRAQAGEKFITLDAQERTLTNEMLLIADSQKGIALAGVMGGQNTEINDQTTDVLIESAYFKPTNIRRTSKAVGLRTDASYRFERGVDIGMAEWASQRCAQLILKTAGGELLSGVVDAYPQKAEPKQITLRHHKVNELLGTQLRPEEIECFLGQLGLKIVGRKPQPLGEAAAPEPVTFRIPSYRVDLKRETDLIEEVVRLHGIDNIKSTPPRGAIGTNAYDSVFDQISEARRILTGMGLNEAQGQTLISDASAKLASSEPLVMLANPLSSDMNALRPSLLPGLLASLRHNISRKNYDVALFEIGRGFTQVNGQTREERRIAIAITGMRSPSYWSGKERDAKCDIYDIKGCVDEFLEQFGLRGVVYSKRADKTALFLESATVTLGGRVTLGEMGQLLPPLAKQYDLRDAVYLVELSLDLLLSKRNPAKNFKPLPQFPSVRRDVAMILPDTASHEAVLQTIKQAKPQNLESVELFDVFRGQNIPEGQKSVAYALTYRHAERTLTDAEVNAAQDKVVAQLKQSLKAVVRE